eukprot:CAMPEP_0118922186 /NCGR_PEP_ID=MMETSP1169-20130426/1197_1 /TAXON_ID=36882 /ORGANISM="Pyramimonas obovata, Strain CCMP722" /LENGTH=423 /DNA_ID=CAMNT_0006863017 /DNA_START=314 /DNA_END=1584 /DNA_ORIENTATION=+
MSQRSFPAPPQASYYSQADRERIAGSRTLQARFDRLSQLQQKVATMHELLNESHAQEESLFAAQEREPLHRHTFDGTIRTPQPKMELNRRHTEDGSSRASSHASPSYCSTSYSGEREHPLLTRNMTSATSTSIANHLTAQSLRESERAEISGLRHSLRNLHDSASDTTETLKMLQAEQQQMRKQTEQLVKSMRDRRALQDARVSAEAAEADLNLALHKMRSRLGPRAAERITNSLETGVPQQVATGESPPPECPQDAEVSPQILTGLQGVGLSKRGLAIRAAQALHQPAETMFSRLQQMNASQASTLPEVEARSAGSQDRRALGGMSAMEQETRREQTVVMGKFIAARLDQFVEPAGASKTTRRLVGRRLTHGADEVDVCCICLDSSLKPDSRVEVGSMWSSHASGLSSALGQSQGSMPVPNM